MAFHSETKRRLSKSILEMKFMKRSKEKAQKEKDAEEGEAMFSEGITKEMKQGQFKYVIEPSFIPCENLIMGRLSFHGMNPEVEKLMELEEEAKRTTKDNRANEADVSDAEMAKHYSTLVEGLSNKFTTKRNRRTQLENGIQSKRRKTDTND